MALKRSVIRTIRNGRVKINGIYYSPEDSVHPTFVPYTGQLDGKRFVFGLYQYGDSPLPFVFMWGSEKEYMNPGSDWPGCNCMDGYFQWQWWYEVKPHTDGHEDGQQ
jgi:hypothetical protein